MTDVQIIKQMAELRLDFANKFNASNPSSPTVFSEIAVKMATLNSMLGEHVASRKKLQFEREKEIYKECQEEGINTTSTNTKIRQESYQERLNFEQIDTAHKDYWKFINVIQTHIGAERDERKPGA